MNFCVRWKDEKGGDINLERSRRLVNAFTCMDVTLHFTDRFTCTYVMIAD